MEVKKGAIEYVEAVQEVQENRPMIFCQAALNKVSN
jgi:hypothetical protein